MKVIKYQFGSALYTREQTRKFGKTKLVDNSRKLQVTLSNCNIIFIVPVIANRRQRFI